MTVKGMVLYRNIVEWKAFIPDLRSRLERERLQNGVKEEIRPNVIYQQIPLVSGTGFLIFHDHNLRFGTGHRHLAPSIYSDLAILSHLVSSDSGEGGYRDKRRTLENHHPVAFVWNLNFVKKNHSRTNRIRSSHRFRPFISTVSTSHIFLKLFATEVGAPLVYAHAQKKQVNKNVMYTDDKNFTIECYSLSRAARDAIYIYIYLDSTI